MQGHVLHVLGFLDPLELFLSPSPFLSVFSFQFFSFPFLLPFSLLFFYSFQFFPFFFFLPFLCLPLLSFQFFPFSFLLPFSPLFPFKLFPYSFLSPFFPIPPLSCPPPLSNSFFILFFFLSPVFLSISSILLSSISLPSLPQFLFPRISFPLSFHCLLDPFFSFIPLFPSPPLLFLFNPSFYLFLCFLSQVFFPRFPLLPSLIFVSSMHQTPTRLPLAFPF